MLETLTAATGYLSLLAGVVFLIDIFVLLPLCILKACRPWCGMAIFWSTILFGIYLWLFAVDVTWMAWGGFWTLVSILFFGVGPLVTGVLALGVTFHEWGNAGLLVLCYIVAIVLRGVGAALAGMIDE